MTSDSPLVVAVAFACLLLAGCAVEGSPDPFVSPVASTTTVAAPVAPGWTTYASMNSIHDLAFAPDGTLWVTTYSELMHWDPSTDTYIRYEVQARDLALAPDGTLWLATDHGLCQLGGEGCRFYTEAHGLIHNGVRSVAVTADGTVWAGTEAGISRFDGRSWVSYPSMASARELAAAPSGEIWAATPAGIGRYHPWRDSWQLYTQEHGLPDAAPEILAVGQIPGRGEAREVWAGYGWQGVYRFDGKRWQRVHEIPQGLVSDIALASDGTPWVATVGSTHYPGGNLSYRGGGAWVDVTSEQRLAPIRAVALGPDGVVAAVTNLGLGVCSEGEWRLWRDGPAHLVATSTAVTPDGAAWFGFGDGSAATFFPGVSRFDGREWEYHLEGVEVNALTVAPDGKLWASAGCDVLRYDGLAWETVGRCEEDLPLGAITDIVFTPDGAAWVASGFWLARYTDRMASPGDGDRWTVYDKLIHSLVVAPDGALWANGWEGRQDSHYVARCADPSKGCTAWQIYRGADSFPGAFQVGAATVDSLSGADGRLWGIVPGRGLTSYDGGQWTEERSWTFYSTGDGLSFEVAVGLAVAPDGALWVVTRRGAARYDPMTREEDAWTAYPWGAYPLSSAVAFGPEGEVWFGTTRLVQE